jgi:starch synthase
VATRAGGLPQAITDGVTGRLVEPRDVPSLAAALASVLADPARAADMGAAARARIVSDFSWPRAVARFVDAYDRACPKLRGSVSVGVPR